MTLSPELMEDLRKCAASLDCNTNPIVIGAHAGWLREIADKVEAEANAAMDQTGKEPS